MFVKQKLLKISKSLFSLRTLRALFQWETYENMMIGFLKFLIKRNPLSALYALVVTVKQKIFNAKGSFDSTQDDKQRRGNDKKGWDDESSVISTKVPSTRDEVEKSLDAKNKNPLKKATRSAHSNSSSPFRKGDKRGFFKKLFRWETYENMVIRTMRFFMHRNPIHLWFWAQYGWKKVVNKALDHPSFRMKKFNQRHPYLSSASSILLIFLMVLGLFSYFVLYNPESAAAWWDDHWTYRKALIIDSDEVAVIAVA